MNGAERVTVRVLVMALCAAIGAVPDGHGDHGECPFRGQTLNPLCIVWC